MSTTRHIRWAALLTLATIAAAAGVPSPAVATDHRPTAVVALGDSVASGEGAGNYEPGTRGENGDWCHRSPLAYVHQVRTAEHSMNLACSGANSANVSLADTVHYTEGSQSARLVGVATRYRVTAVVVQVGTDDDPDYEGVLIACAQAYLEPLGPSCEQTVGPQWSTRLAAMADKVVAALADVRSAMSQAGYAPGSYDLVLASYASPATEKMVPLVQGVAGCPFRRSDARWGRTVAVPQLSEALRGAARRAGTHFLDLSRAAEGREACSRLTTAGEWQTRLLVNPDAFVQGRTGAAGTHLVQESFHPNSTGHAQIAQCLREFLNGGLSEGQCRIGEDGQLHVLRHPAR